MPCCNSRITWIVLTLLLYVCAGCKLAGFLSKATGGPTIEAEYVMNKRPLLILVKDQPDPIGEKVEAEEIDGLIERQFIYYDIAPLIPSTKATELRSDRPADYAVMSPAQIGHAVGADQVLYVQIIRSEMESEATQDMLRGRIATMISVLDANSGAILWPTDGSGGVAVATETRLARLSDRTSAQSIQRQVHNDLAEKITKFFRKYKSDD